MMTEPRRRYLRYCDDPQAVEQEITNSQKLRSAYFLLSEVMHDCRHQASLGSLGAALTYLRQTQVKLEEHIEYYVGRLENEE